MKFPITRESLQSFDQKAEDAEKKKERIRVLLECDVKEICNAIVKGMSIYSREKRFIWTGVNNVRMRVENPSEINIDEYLSRIIERLKETFIGCDIICDPLKSYIVIDWS
jgi:hypothetical protein